MDIVKVYKKNPPGASGTNFITVDGDSWYEVFTSQDDRLDLWVLENNDDVVIIKGSTKLRVKSTAV